MVVDKELIELRKKRFAEIGLKYEPPPEEPPLFSDIIEWQTFDTLCEYLRNHTTIDAFDLLYDAIYCVANEIVKSKVVKGEISHGQLGEIVDYCLGHTIPEDCDRHNKLFKNIAIWCVNSGFSDKVIDEIDIKIIANCPGRKRGEIKGWGPFARKKRREVNLKEIEDVVKLVEGKNGRR